MLPAGLYFRPHYLRTAVGDGVPPPSIAAVAGVYDSPAEAERAVRAVPLASRSPGYPWVVDARELGVADATLHGLAVVLGLFAERADADAWCAAAPAGRSASELLAVLTQDALDQRYADARARSPSATARGVDHAFVQVLPWGDAPAFAPEDVATMRGSLGAIEGGRWVIERRTASLRPLCVLPANTVVTASTHACGESVYDFAPITCDGRPACVRQTDARRWSVIEARPDGAVRVSHVVDVNCDTPTHLERSFHGGRMRSQRLITPRCE